MLYNNAPFGQASKSIVVNIFVETSSTEYIAPPPGDNLLLDNSGNYFLDNSGSPLLIS